MTLSAPDEVSNIRQFVLDACSLIALLRREEGSEKVAALLHRAEQGEVRLLVHRVTLAEVYYDVLRFSGKAEADITLESLNGLAISVLDDLSNVFIQKVGKYKVTHKISFADAFVLALAQSHNAAVVSSDHHEFEAVAQSGILSFFWIR